MVTDSISAFSNLFGFMTEAIKEANEPYYVTLQKSFRGDRAAVRKIEQQEEQMQLQERLQNRTSQPAVSQSLDIFA